MAYAREPEEYEEESGFGQTIKGIIAVFITILIVVIIVMLFAKSLFVSDSTLAKNVKTGHLTETAYVEVDPAAIMNEQVVTTAEKKKTKATTTTEEEKPALPEGLDTSVEGDYIVNDAVYLHPEPNSSSENLTTLPKGADVKVYGTANYGWYYVDYDGQLGYAWGTYFTKK